MTKNIITYCFFLFFMLLQHSVFSQFSSEEERMDHANELFNKKLFIEAEPHMLHFLSLKKSTEFNFKYGVCTLFKYADKSKSLRYLEKACKDANVDPRAHFYLGKANHFNFLFADAIKSYNKYKSLVSDKEAKELDLEMNIQMCESGQNLMKNLSDLIVEEKTSTAIDKFQYSYDLSEIGGRILTTDLFQSKMDVKLDYKSIIYFPPVGTDILFFSSYGNDGSTGLDIYYVSRLSTGEWSEPNKLPENINTPYDDSFPFLQPDGKTLYFSSKGHNSMGGYDIFRCSYDVTSNNYGPVDNLDYKINTTSDDILYIVDENNINAYFSSDRASEGGKIDVYKVKVKVFPIQNTVVAGTFSNDVNPNDLMATIKVQDIKTDKLIGIYTVDKKNNYTILLPNAGKYKFIVETPTSEKIHAGLVEVKPQTELKALKQEIKLVNNDGLESLVITNLFDQSHENETKILASVVKQMANPEVNIDQIPDSILNSIDNISIEEDSQSELVDTSDSGSSIEQLLLTNTTNISNAESKLKSLEEQRDKANMVAQTKATNSEQKAKQADQLLVEASSIDDENLKNQKLQEAAKLNLESKKLNEQALKAVSVTKRIQQDIDLSEQKVDDLKILNNKLSSTEQTNSDFEELSQEVSILSKEDPSPMDKILSDTKAKEKEANSYLAEAKALREDKESMQYQLDQQKDNLSRVKKKKDIAAINETIQTLEQKILESEVLIDQQFELYETSENERKELSNEAEQMEEIELAQIDENTVITEPIDLVQIEEKANNVKTNYIDKNSIQFDTIIIEDVQLNEDEITVESNETVEEITFSDTLIEPDEIEHYNEVSESLESTTTSTEDFADITETIISYNNDDAQVQADDLENKKEEIISIQAEISNLENELSSTTKPNKIQEIQTQLEVKKNLLNNTEDQLVKSYEEINNKEIEHNNDEFVSSSKDLNDEAKSDDDFLSATYYMESASKALEKASNAREEANSPSTSPEKRKELLKLAYVNEMVAIDDQQTANNLMKDVMEKYPSEESTDNEPITTEIEKEEIIAAEEEQEQEFIESLPVNIPVVKEESPVPIIRFQGQTFDPKAEPDNYEVVAVADNDTEVSAEEISNVSNRAIIESNQSNIDKVNELESQKEILELQKNDLIGEKLIAKVDKKIQKIEKKKAKSQIKMSDDIATVNQSEIAILNEQVKASNSESKNIKNQYKVTQASNYEESANDLNDQALKLREEAKLKKDPVAKAVLLEKAIASENTAISYLKKSKKLYDEAIVEDFSDDKLTVAKSVQGNENTQSEKLEDLAGISEDKAIEFQKQAQKIREESVSMKKKERAAAMVIAQQYDDLAKEQMVKSEDYKVKSKKFKEIEMAVVEDITLAKEVEGQDMSFIAGTEEFKAYNENQKNLNELNLKREEIKIEKQSYDQIAAQMDAKSAALDQQAKSEKNPIKRADLVNESNQFKIKAKENKQLADALVISIDSLKDGIRSKEMDQEIILDGLDSIKRRQVRGLAVSGKADEIINQIAQDLPENKIEDELEEIIEMEDEKEDTVKDLVLPSAPNSPSVSVIRSKNFVPPTKIVDDIFVVTNDAVYSKENPIPVNPKLPDGLVYKVQVGAFRNPIPQDLFKGFAPISAEKVRDDITRYRVGYFTSFDIANDSKNKVRQLGYKDAFVVAIMNGERITISEAKGIQTNQPVVVSDPIINDSENNTDLTIDNTENNEVIEVNNDENLAEAVSAVDIKGVFYSVQVGAFSKPLSSENELNVSPLVVSKMNNLFKYSTGRFNSIEDAAKRKAVLLDNGIEDAFIIAYSDGKVISLTQANSNNPNREVEYKNPEIYYLDFGTYQDEVPQQISDVVMNLKALNIRSRPMLMGKQYYSKKFTSIKEAEQALEQVQLKGLKSAKIVSSKKDDFDLNYEFKIELGKYFEELPPKLQNAFDNLKGLNIESIEVDNATIYYTMSRDNFDDATTDLNACRSQDLNIAKIVVFKGGVETSMDNVLKSFK